MYEFGKMTAASNYFWTEEEIQYLKEKYPLQKTPISEIAAHLNRSFAATKLKAQQLNIYRRRLWTKEEIDFLKKNYTKEHYTVEQICNYLDRPYSSIKNKAVQLNLLRRRYWTQEELDYLKLLIPEFPLRVAQKKYNLWASRSGFSTRTLSSIINKLRNEKISRKLDSSEWLTAQDLTILFGISLATANSWLRAYKDELKPIPLTDSDPKKAGIRKAVHRRKLKKFCLNNPSLLELHQKTLNIFWFIDIVKN